MKRFFGLVFVFLLAGMLSSSGLHKFYVAVFRMEHVPEKKVIQMTSRVFIDEIETALFSKYRKKMYIGTSKEVPGLDNYLAEYFTAKMQVKINGSEKGIKYLGREIEDDILECYYTIPADGAITSLEISNTVLFESFEEQENIIHATIKRNKKSLLLTNENPKGILDF